jgi:hypothetical protein
MGHMHYICNDYKSFRSKLSKEISAYLRCANSIHSLVLVYELSETESRGQKEWIVYVL